MARLLELSQVENKAMDIAKEYYANSSCGHFRHDTDHGA